MARSDRCPAGAEGCTFGTFPGDGTSGSHEEPVGEKNVIHTRRLDFSWRLPELEWPVTTEVGPGLDGVIASGTRVSWLDPSSGTLHYRGVPVERLAGVATFEQVAFLLITGTSHTRDEEGFRAFRDRLRESRNLPDDVVDLIRDMDPGIHPTRMLRAGVSALGCHELSEEDDLAGESHWRELRIVGQVTALVGEIARHRKQMASPDYRHESSLARCTLGALRGRVPDPEDVALLDLLLVLYADHGLDAPTFISMIVASTRADPYYNVVAGLSGLRGGDLGGATERVLKQILPLQNPEDARRWVVRQLDAGGSIAGFGHRMYRMSDPRVVILRREFAALARRRRREELFHVARAVEDQAMRFLSPKGVHININFYAALIFHLLGAEGPMMPCLYAVGRMAGLVARVSESLDSSRLYRPLSRYVGPEERTVAKGGAA